MIRHGDVLLVPIGAPDDAGVEFPREVILADGEVTGHAHRVHGLGVRMWSDGLDLRAGMRLDVPLGAWLRHEEHRRVRIPAGRYEVRIQRTMTQPGSWDRVAD